MAIDPIIPLAYNLADGKKRYVLFCGAGISKDANVPTGWDILLDTLRFIRNQEEIKYKEYTDVEMNQYYEEKYKDLTYSEIIGSLFPSLEGQRAFLKSKFKEAVLGNTHKLIAEFVKTGLIRFIVTTNFDTLLEQALDEEGLKSKYTVISNDKDVLTSKPWNNVECCRIYKIHGTIDQGEIRNTEKDLVRLGKNLRKDFLDIIERHGVIVLGYAGNEEDKAVMDVFNKRKFHGYTLYWCVHKDCKDKVKELIEKQDGCLIKISSASEFLEELLIRVKIARSGTDQSSKEVALVRFATILSTGSNILIKQTINDEKKKLIKNIRLIFQDMDESSKASLWESFVKIYKSSHNYFSLIEQVTKYSESYWEEISYIFDELISLKKNSSSKYQKELIDYLLFVYIELISGILIENKAFNSFRSLVKKRILDQNRNKMISVLDIDRNPRFITEKNKLENKIYPCMYNLLQLIEIEKLPFDWDVREKIIDADLLLFAYTSMNPFNEYDYYWEPESIIYIGYEGSNFLKLMALDTDTGNDVAKEIFDTDYKNLKNMMAIPNQKIEYIKQNNMNFSFMENPFSIFTSK